MILIYFENGLFLFGVTPILLKEEAQYQINLLMKSGLQHNETN